MPITKSWQGHGKEVDTDDPAAAFTRSKLDFKVEFLPISSSAMTPWNENVAKKWGSAKRVKSAIARMTVRPDTGEEMGVVGNSYTILQNEEVSALIKEFLKAKIDGKLAAPDGKVERVGYFQGGQRLYAIVNLGDIKVGPHTLTRSIVMTWSHDGWWSFTSKFVCRNKSSNAVLSAGIKGVTDTVRIKHTQAINEKVKQAALTMKQAINYFATVREKFDVLAYTDISNAHAQEFLEEMFHSPSESEGAETRMKEKREKIWGVIQGGPGQHTGKGTLWAIFNGIAQYETHTAGGLLRAGSAFADREEAKLHADLFGTDSYHLTRDAFKKLMEMAA